VLCFKDQDTKSWRTETNKILVAHRPRWSETNSAVAGALQSGLRARVAVALFSAAESKAWVLMDARWLTDAFCDDARAKAALVWKPDTKLLRLEKFTLPGHEHDLSCPEWFRATTRKLRLFYANLSDTQISLFWTPYNQHVNNLYQQDPTPAVWRRPLKAHIELEAELVAKFNSAEFWAANSPLDIDTLFEAILERKKMEPVSPEKTQGKRQIGDDAEVSGPKRQRIATPGQGNSYSNGGHSFQGFPNAFTPNPHFPPQQQPATFQPFTSFQHQQPHVTFSQNGSYPFAGQPLSPISPPSGYGSSPNTTRKTWGNAASMARTGNQASTPQRNGGRGTNIPVCFRCTLKGHYANNCSEQKSQVAGFEIGASYEDNVWKFKGTPFCMRYQSGSCESAVSCRRAHICSFCGDDHPAPQCQFFRA
jgi:hypothetical protein